MSRPTLVVPPVTRAILEALETDLSWRGSIILGVRSTSADVATVEAVCCLVEEGHLTRCL